MKQDLAIGDERQQQLEAWVHAHTRSAVKGIAASSDASFRRYFRYPLPEADVIAMDAPPPQEDCKPFVDIAHRLKVAGLNVPEILAEDIARGFLLLSDLGKQTYLDVLSEDNAEPLFADALQTLVTMQANADTEELPHYDRAMLTRELALFPEWYLGHHLAQSVDELAWQAAIEPLLAAILQQPKVFVHRDFMPRNLMISSPNPGVLDFQDAVLGPISYDPICLFKDAFVSWPEAKVDQWLQHYWQLAKAKQLPLPETYDAFRRDCDLMGLHRHLKVIGIFARIAYRDGKPRYLEDVPRFVDYLRPVLAAYPELAKLRTLLANYLDVAP